MDNSNSRSCLLEHIAFQSGRKICGHTRDTNTHIEISINNIWTYNSGWSQTTEGTTYSATSDDEGYFEIELPEDLEITSLAACFGTGTCMDQLLDVNLAYIGDVSKCESMLYMFDSNSYLEKVQGFSKFQNATSNKTCEGMFRSNLSITTVDFTGMSTEGMDSSIMSRYGWPVIFYNVTSLTNLTLPEMSSKMYMGSSAFSGCTGLKNVKCSGTISCNHVYFQDCPLTLESMRQILSHLTTTPVSGAECKFSDSSLSAIRSNEECMEYYNAAKENGWTMPDMPYYTNACVDEDYFEMNSYYLKGTETDTSQAMYGKVYVVMNQTSSTPTTYWTFYLNADHSSFDLSDGTDKTLSFSMKGIDSGLERAGVTIQSSSYAPMYIQFIDSDGNTSDWVSPINGGTIAAGSVTAGTLALSTVSGIDMSSVLGFRVMFNNTTDSAKSRKKGVWFSSISIS